MIVGLAAGPPEGSKSAGARLHKGSHIRREFLSGILGGGAVAAVAVLALLSTGGLRRSSKIVTVVQQAPAVTTNAARLQIGVTAHQIYERDAPGVVLISAAGISEPRSPSELYGGEGGRQGAATGSGFEIDNRGTILTNWHVVANASKMTVSLGEHGRSVEAQILGKDPSHDLAVLQIPTAGLLLHPLPLGDSRSVQIGEPVLAVGNPFGYGRTLTSGIVSALERQIQAPSGVTITGALQTDAPINPGSSGGPLLNAQGQVIGINSQIVTSGSAGGNVGIAFAIPIDTAKSELPTLERGGTR
jgi:S1-C subfamily serine protease